ncbi:hypothetical protein AB0B28_18050 [Glycomyces sp. NPDC046736]|uniref:hypothetical protein n=1 Tax=Glycomyces sp. NPDC046736 TaxID=3155615 RepID=UPI0033C9AF6F
MTSRVFRALAAALAVVFALDSAAHLLWTTGSTWPADDTRLPSYALLGSEVSFASGVLPPLVGMLSRSHNSFMESPK